MAAFQSQAADTHNCKHQHGPLLLLTGRRAGRLQLACDWGDGEGGASTCRPASLRLSLLSRGGPWKCLEPPSHEPWPQDASDSASTALSWPEFEPRKCYTRFPGHLRRGDASIYSDSILCASYICNGPDVATLPSSNKGTQRLFKGFL